MLQLDLRRYPVLLHGRVQLLERREGLRDERLLEVMELLWGVMSGEVEFVGEGVEEVGSGGAEEEFVAVGLDGQGEEARICEDFLCKVVDGGLGAGFGSAVWVVEGEMGDAFVGAEGLIGGLAAVASDQGAVAADGYAVTGLAGRDFVNGYDLAGFSAAGELQRGGIGVRGHLRSGVCCVAPTGRRWKTSPQSI